MASNTPIKWYKSPVGKDVLRELRKRSDLKGLIQSVGHLTMIVLTAAATLWSAAVWPWPATVALLFLHGTVSKFSINAMHELSHGTVFKTKALNGFFLKCFSFICWANPYVFKASHNKHHQFTLHPENDQEVLPGEYPTWKDILRSVFDPVGFGNLVWETLRHAFVKLNGSWEESLFPTVKSRSEVVSWARILIIGHGLVLVVSLATGWWLISVLVSCTPLYGGLLQYLGNQTQHCGLPGNVPDWRVNCRSVKIDPLTSFLYWRMEYHIEHHMYTGVPCYNLKRLFREIRDDLPPRYGVIKALKRDAGME